MGIDVNLPNLGEGVDSGEVAEVLVSVGDEITEEQDIIEIETDKAVVPVPSSAAGKITAIHVQAGDTVPVGAKLITVDAVGAEQQAPAPTPAEDQPAEEASTEAQASEEAESPARASPEPAIPNATDETDQASSALEPSPAKPVVAAKVPPQTAKSTAPALESANGGLPVAAGPATRRLARELGVDLNRVQGSGPGGRISRDDVIQAVREGHRGSVSPGGGAEERDAWGVIRVEPLSKIRRTIAAKMHESASTIPHVTNFDDADITELDHIRKGGMADYAGGKVKLTMMPFVMKAVALSLRQHPEINASLDLENGKTIYKQYINLGVAVDTERGLVVPAIRGVDRLSIPQIAHELTEIVDKVRGGGFQVEDLRGGTFTISNLGAIGGTYSTPIINHPEVAILLVGRSRKLPVVVEGNIEIRLMMPLSLSYDHRLVDGAMAARFLNDVISFLEAPGRLLLAP